MSFVERLARLDVSLFDYVENQTGSDDRRSLLAIHKALREALGTISYLEIGSHLGGSLQAMVADERCRRIVSIDPRPEYQPDERPGLDRWEYPTTAPNGCSGCCRRCPGGLAKLETVELSTEDLRRAVSLAPTSASSTASTLSEPPYVMRVSAGLSCKVQA